MLYSRSSSYPSISQCTNYKLIAIITSYFGKSAVGMGIISSISSKSVQLQFIWCVGGKNSMLHTKMI